MTRPCFWFVLLALVSGLCAAQMAPEGLAAVLKNMPEDQRGPFLQALALDDAGDLAGAENTLQPFVDSGRADVYVSVLLGSFLARDKQWQGAARAYQAALNTLGSKPNAFPWNVEEGMGEALLHLEQFKEASRHLELALQHCKLDAEDDNLNDIAGQAYQGAGEQALAIQAYVDAVCINPFRKNTWVALNHIAASEHPDHFEWSTLLAAPPSQVRLADMTQVAHAVDSSQPLSDDDRFAYVRIADAMYQADRVKPASRFLRAAFRDYLDREWPEAEIRLNVERTLALLDSFGFLPRLTVGTQYHLLSLLMIDRIEKGRYAQVIPAVHMIAVLALNDAQKQEMTGYLKDFYRDLFAAVSFDPATGRPRFTDPDDFLGPCMDEFREGGVDQAHRHRDPAEIPSRDASGKCLVKYGTLNATEDLATTASDVVTGEDFTGPLLPILKDCVREKKFDVPVKAILAKLIDGDVHDIERGKVGRMSLTDLDRAVVAAGPGQVHEITLEAFDAAKEAPALFRMFTVAKSPEKKLRGSR